MKKLLYFFSVIALMTVAASCEPNDDPNNVIDDTTTTTTFRIKQLRDAWDWWDFIYEDGKIVKVDRDNGDRVWNFAWTGNTCAVTGRDEFSFELGDNGMISKLNFKGEYTYTYDKDGHMTEAKKDGAVVSTIVITDGNITKITEGDNVCEFEYGSEVNDKGIQHQYQDEYNEMLPKWYRFMIESGLLGKPSAKVPTTFTYNGEKVCDYVFETEKIEDVDYIVMKTAKVGGKEQIHKYLFEEVK